MVIGFISPLGYCYCNRCAEERQGALPLPAGWVEVIARSYPHSAEICDACGKPLDSTEAQRAQAEKIARVAWEARHFGA